MINCRLCNTRLEKKHLRRDGSLLCPECGQIYWKYAVEKALKADNLPSAEEEKVLREKAYRRESRRSAELIARKVQVA